MGQRTRVSICREDMLPLQVNLIGRVYPFFNELADLDCREHEMYSSFY